MTKFPAAINIIVPGAGLIALRREWLGLAVAILFGMLAQIGVVGILLAPAEMPTWISVTASACALVTWLWAQWLVANRISTSTGELIEREVSLLRKKSDDAITAGRFEDAHQLLRAGLAINDEDLGLNRMYAELSERQGQNRDALRAWKRVCQLTPDAQTKSAVRNAISRLQG